MSEVLSATNLKFLAQGLWTTLYLSFFIIVLSTLFGTILAVMRNGKNPILSWSSNSSLQRQVLPRSRSSHQLPWRKSFVEDLTLSTMDKRKPACLKDLTTDKSLFILSSHKLFVRCYHLSFLNS